MTTQWTEALCLYHLFSNGAILTAPSTFITVLPFLFSFIFLLGVAGMAVELITMPHAHRPRLPYGSSIRRPDAFAASNAAEDCAVQEAAAGLRSIHKLIGLMSAAQRRPPESSDSPEAVETDCSAVAGAAVSKFRNVISLLDRTRTGHARFRRAPVPSSRQIGERAEPAAPIHQIPPVPFPIPRHRHLKGDARDSAATVSFGYSPAMSAVSAPTSFISSLNVDADGLKPGTPTTTAGAFQITNLPPATSLKRKCSSTENGLPGRCGGPSGSCHCSKRKKQRLRREVRVPAISMKMADIPPDEYSWRKYGQKPIKGSPHPRGYYKCSSLRGCPARKHVERAVDDPAMLVVTYEGEHIHPLSAAPTAALILESS